MTSQLSEAFKKAQNLPDYLQNELAEQLLEDIQNELKWQQELSGEQPSQLEQLAAKALEESSTGKIKELGFDEL